MDKPPGPTSHEAVARIRRALRTRQVGHAGTLDPMASGVLVVLAGEATKLVPYLTAEDKRYEARVALGVGTDTLDAEGEITGEAPIPAWLAGELSSIAAGGEGPRIQAALAAERAREAQVPPAHSAIKVGGQRSYARARAGQAVELAPRQVAVRSLRVLGASAAPAALDLALEVGKGYYVRSLARDLGERLGVPAHLTALRRTASGGLTIDLATPLDAPEEQLRQSLLPLEAAAQRSLPAAQLTEEGARRARAGQRLRRDDFSRMPPPEEVAAWLSPDGRLVAIGANFTVLRGFSRPNENDEG